ncbi:MAG: hypothetical protein FWD69_07160 [Polyangiaceae bacterium]|nr:hypothetical protein [Polyangiaceae bacterium]
MSIKTRESVLVIGRLGAAVVLIFGIATYKSWVVYSEYVPAHARVLNREERICTEGGSSPDDSEYTFELMVYPDPPAGFQRPIEPFPATWTSCEMRGSSLIPKLGETFRACFNPKDPKQIYPDRRGYVFFGCHAR